MRRAFLILLLLLSMGPASYAGDLWGDPPPPPRPRTEIQWRESLEEARQEAMRAGRLLLVADGAVNSGAWSNPLTELLSEQFICVQPRQRWMEEDGGPPGRRDMVRAARIYLCTSDGFVLDALDGAWPSDAVEQEARWTLDAVRSMTRSGAAVERGEAARTLSSLHSEEATRLAQSDSSSPRIAFHQAQAQSPLASVATLAPWRPSPPPRRGG